VEAFLGRQETFLLALVSLTALVQTVLAGLSSGTQTLVHVLNQGVVAIAREADWLRSQRSRFSEGPELQISRSTQHYNY